MSCYPNQDHRSGQFSQCRGAKLLWSLYSTGPCEGQTLERECIEGYEKSYPNAPQEARPQPRSPMTTVLEPRRSFSETITITVTWCFA